MSNKNASIALLVIASLLVSPVVVADENEDIPTNASATGVHDSLVAALDKANLVATLQGDGPFTVFAPTDQAFADAGIDLDSFNTDAEIAALTDILLYHVYSGAVYAADVTDGLTVAMVNGDDLTFSVVDGTVSMGDGSTVTTADVVASNGVIHVIDKVLMPAPDITEEDGDICYNMATHTLVAGASFEECMAYMYVVDYEMNGQTFTGCYNTVSHDLSMVTQEVCESYMWTPAVDIGMTAQATTIHNSLVAAVVQAELLTTLQGDGPFTVFAPTDDAFTAAGIDLAALDNEEGKAALTDILLYHVYSGSVAAADVTDGMTATMVNGDDATFTVGDGVMINDANVILADVMASNGIIHVIDKVLMPPADIFDIPTTAQGTGIHDSLVAAVIQAELLTTLQGDGPFTVFAPTDQAFADAGIDLAALDNEDGKAALTDILLYHVVSGSVASSAVTDGMTAAAVNGDDLTFSVGEGVMVNDANVILADVMATNGIIHVIDKVLMPPANAPDTTGCDAVIGIDESGMAYDTPYLEVDVGATVCWVWTDESMAHNVAQIAKEGDTTRYMGGVYSGESMTTVDFRYTFDVDQTFNYICEPHATTGMEGQIVVGTGSIDTPDDDDDASLPGFTAGIAALAVFGAVMLVAGRRQN